MKTILICGAPGTGKSSVAQKLARELGIHQVIGTDTIREVARSYSTKEERPSLYTSAILYSDQAPEGEDKMIWGFHKQAEDVAPGISAVLTRSEKEDKDVIIEGIHPIPQLFSETENKNYIFITLKVTLEEKHLTQLAGQGSERSSYKIENFKKARAFQDYLIQQAEKTNIHVVENESLDQAVQTIKQIVSQ